MTTKKKTTPAKRATRAPRAVLPNATPETKSPLGKAVRETFAAFFEDPSRDKLRALLQHGDGEMRQLDFKADWPKAGPLAKHVLAIGNSGGGCLVVGVAETTDGTFEPTGLEKISDKAVITNALKTTIPDALLSQIQILNLAYDSSDWGKLAGKKFQVLLIESDADHLPHLAVKNGEDLQAGVIYVRREGGSAPASYEEVQRLIRTRLASGRPNLVELDLKDHLEQLKVLYEQIPKYKMGGVFGMALADHFGGLLGALSASSEPNPNYPAEGFEPFVAKLIAKKKRRIAEELDVPFD